MIQSTNRIMHHSISMTISSIYSDKNVMNFCWFSDFQKSITSTATISKSKSPHLKILKSESPHVFHVPHFLSLISPHLKPHENYLWKVQILCVLHIFSVLFPCFLHIFSTPHFLHKKMWRKCRTLQWMWRSKIREGISLYLKGYRALVFLSAGIK